MEDPVLRYLMVGFCQGSNKTWLVSQFSSKNIQLFNDFTDLVGQTWRKFSIKVSSFLLKSCKGLGFKGFDQTHQFLERGSRAHQFLSISNRNLIVWHFTCLNLDIQEVWDPSIQNHCGATFLFTLLISISVKNRKGIGKNS